MDQVEKSAVSLRVAAARAQEAGLVAQGFHGCQCEGLRVRVRHGELDFHLPTCESWRPVAQAVQKSLADAGFRVEVLELVRRNL